MIMCFTAKVTVAACACQTRDTGPGIPEEVTDLIEWMRQHNLSCQREQMCQFIGYDIKPTEDTFSHIQRLMPAEYLNEANLARIEELMHQDSLSEEEKDWLGDAILSLHGMVFVRDQEIRAFCRTGRVGPAWALYKHALAGIHRHEAQFWGTCRAGQTYGGEYHRDDPKAPRLMRRW